MASIAERAGETAAPSNNFFLYSAIAMTLVIVAGFSVQLAMGRSSFASPLLVHAHAIVFMGWVTINLLQNIFVASRQRTLHRTLGWMATGWIAAMVVLGLAVTVAMARRGQVPFFFQPLHFLIFDPLSLCAFVGLTVAAIHFRRRTQWHRRLHYCAMAMLLGPGFGRLLPMPMLAPWAFEATFLAVMIFPLIGVAADYRRDGAVHPAWRWGIGAMAATLILIEALTYSSVGQLLYRLVTAGSPGAEVAPLGFPPPSTGPITGRTTGA